MAGCAGTVPARPLRSRVMTEKALKTKKRDSLVRFTVHLRYLDSEQYWEAVPGHYTGTFRISNSSSNFHWILRGGRVHYTILKGGRVSLYDFERRQGSLYRYISNRQRGSLYNPFRRLKCSAFPVKNNPKCLACLFRDVCWRCGPGWSHEAHWVGAQYDGLDPTRQAASNYPGEKELFKFKKKL